MRVLAFLIFATPASAGMYQLPQGCEGVVTVQAIDCTVTHYYQCQTDDGGNMHRVDIGEEGLTFYTRTDEEARWIESLSVFDDYKEMLGAEVDPASISTLIKDGVDTWDFNMDSTNGTYQRFVGYDSLTGAEEEVDGVILKRTSFEMRAENMTGETSWSSSGSEYILPEWNIFIGGTSTVVSPEGEYDRDGSPVQFDFPGDDGYLSTRPIYGCSVNLT